MNRVRFATAIMVLALSFVSFKAGAADKKPVFEPTVVEQAVMDEIKAADPQAKPQLLRNKFCPITGTPVNPAILPVDCPYRFQHIHYLVAVASTEAAKAY